MSKRYLIDTAPQHVRVGMLSGRLVSLAAFYFVGALWVCHALSSILEKEKKV